MRAYPWFITCLIVLFGAALAIPAPAVDSVTLETRRTGGALVSLITVDLNDPTVRVDIGLPEKGISHAESFRGFVRRHSPVAAVTGTYFDLRTYLPVGSIVVRGKLVHLSDIGTAVCFTSDNKVRFIDAKRGEGCDLSGAECGLRTGPRLLANGRYALNPRREGFRHPGLFGARTRMALGVTAHNKLLLAFVRTPVTFARAASIMRSLGAMDAVCLDGGTSSAMYYRGQMVQHPGRMLTNVIEVLRRPMPLIPPPLAKIAMQPPAERVALNATSLGNSSSPYPSVDIGYEQAAVLGDPIKLRPTRLLYPKSGLTTRKAEPVG